MRKLFAVLPLAMLLAACGDLPTASDPTVAAQFDKAPWSAPSTPARIIVFGDSHSDLGNLSAPPPYFEGRWTNGPTWIDELASQLGVPALTASYSGGTGYAWGGASTGSGLAWGFIPNVGEQVAEFLGQDALAGDELLVLWAGTNDGIGNVLWGGGAAPASAVQNISAHISDLADAGGKLFLVPDLHGLGNYSSPYFGGAGPSAKAWTHEFNALLRTELKALARSRDIRILRFEENDLVEELMDHPRKYGLKNVTDQACPGCFENYGGTAVSNPDDYLWWDAVHFTRVVHAILGAEAAKLVLQGDDD